MACKLCVLLVLLQRSHSALGARLKETKYRRVDPAEPCTSLSAPAGYAAVQQDALENATLFQVQGLFRLEDAEPCNPLCKWECDSPKCEAACSPQCKPPKCETRCRHVESDSCKQQCSEPQCTVTCPKHQCADNQCAGCFTSCTGKPSCFLNCSAAQPCETVCEDPVCDWSCSKPSSCPAPQCRMQCSMPKGCPAGTSSQHRSLPPKDAAETVVKTFQVPVPQLPACGGGANQQRWVTGLKVDGVKWVSSGTDHTRQWQAKEQARAEAKAEVEEVEGQTPGTTSGKFDCFTPDIAQWWLSWTDEKRKWCCANRGTGCEEVPKAGAKAGEAAECPDCPECSSGGGGGKKDCRRFNCQSADAEMYLTHWSLQKQDHCCREENVGCKFDCMTDADCFEEAWSHERQQWCCEHTQRGCPKLLTPQDMQGCKHNPTCKFDCFDGIDQSVWSAERKEWCCLHAHLGCAPFVAAVGAPAPAIPAATVTTTAPAATAAATASAATAPAATAPAATATAPAATALSVAGAAATQPVVAAAPTLYGASEDCKGLRKRLRIQCRES